MRKRGGSGRIIYLIDSLIFILTFSVSRFWDFFVRKEAKNVGRNGMKEKI